MSKQAKSALATILDRVNQLGTLQGGDVNSGSLTEVLDPPSRAPTPPVFRDPIDHKLSAAEGNIEKIVEIDPNLIRNWEYHDRTPEELGDLDSLAAELKNVGQLQPCIVRPCTDPIYKFEVLVGERRWRASKIAAVPLKAVVKNLTDHDAALYQAIENSNRKDLSEYAKGMSYSNLVEKGIITQKDIQSTLQLSQSSIRNLLSFSKIRSDITKFIENFTKVSATTAYEITRLQEKGPEYVSALIELADRIRYGKIGHTKLVTLVTERIKQETPSKGFARPVTTKNGRHVFTWRNDSNGQTSITFPKNTRTLIDYPRLEEILIEEIQNQLLELENMN